MYKSEFSALNKWNICNLQNNKYTKNNKVASLLKRFGLYSLQNIID